VYSAYPTVTIPSDIIGKPIAEATAELEKLGIVVRTSNRDTTKMPQAEIDALKESSVRSLNPVRLPAHPIHKKKTTTLHCISIDGEKMIARIIRIVSKEYTLLDEKGTVMMASCQVRSVCRSNLWQEIWSKPSRQITGGS
jgi:hypothetical protein